MDSLKCQRIFVTKSLYEICVLSMVNQKKYRDPTFQHLIKYREPVVPIIIHRATRREDKPWKVKTIYIDEVLNINKAIDKVDKYDKCQQTLYWYCENRRIFQELDNHKCTGNTVYKFTYLYFGRMKADIELTCDCFRNVRQRESTDSTERRRDQRRCVICPGNLSRCRHNRYKRRLEF